MLSGTKQTTLLRQPDVAIANRPIWYTTLRYSVVGFTPEKSEIDDNERSV